ATVEGVEGITGLSINYYAMVNLQGFRNMVQAVGGLTLNVRDRIPIGGVGGPVTGYIEPGVQRLNGFETLWFARSRESADDYSRMARQKCVMNAMLHQISPETVLFNFDKIARASAALITTDIPASQASRFIELALAARQHPVRTISFVPPLINTGRPDIAKIQQLVRDAIHPPAHTTSKGHTKHTVTSGANAGVSTEGAIGSMNSGYAANQASDLGAAC
ncbi:MAG: cell envelope-related transcriptional attenuator, partial [Marmoricola sp.]|nr:cell envelope-related transcriptional attenuator [Marmoricola sp.]